ncbi:MAG: ArsR/SmtB family transcription factor [Marinibacterium sp.]
MEQDTAIDAFAALAHPTRLAVFRLLVRHVPNGVPALTIADRLEARPSTLSGHLAVLKRAGLVGATRHQREIRYAARIPAISKLVEFLLSDCCGGQICHCSDILSLLRASDGAREPGQAGGDPARPAAGPGHPE